MRLLTLTSLKSPAKDVADGFPLGIEIEDFEVRESAFQRDFIVHILPSIDWNSVKIAAKAVGLDGIPDKFNVGLLDDGDFLVAMHNLLLDIHVSKGVLVCPESGRRFPIIDGIPNMMLNEDEV